ncbi:MAG: ester cyclase [Alphaproteobacteria bacterium]|nr:ester cyclase [Alphaproteobacteria bacterium]
MAEREVMLVRRWFEEVWNQRRVEAMDELLAADARVYGLGAGNDVVIGPAGFRPAYEQLLGAFPDIHFTVEDAISVGDLVALRWTARATHTGDHLGVPATGETVTITGMVFARAQDGKMVEGWNNWDMLGLMHATGQVPGPKIVGQ